VGPLLPIPEERVEVVRPTAPAVAEGFVLVGGEQDAPPKPEFAGEEEATEPDDAVERRPENRGVEALALAHYLSRGPGPWTKGMHSENGVLLTVFGLLMRYEPETGGSARAPFDDAPFPARFASDADALRAREWARARLVEVRAGRAPELVGAAWDRAHGAQIRGVNWTRNSRDELVLLCGLMGPRVLHTACALLLAAYDAWCGGLPDLLLWGAHAVAFVEVKGPGDSLSDRQRAWGEKLVAAGADVRVCYLRYVGEPEPRWGTAAPSSAAASGRRAPLSTR